MLSSEELAYVAGIIDGEGSISLIRATHKTRPVRRRNVRSLHNPNPGTCSQTLLRVTVGMTDWAIPEWLHLNFGGQVFYRKMKNANWKERCDWCVSCKDAANFLQAILPYLRLKKAQAEIALVFQENRVPGLPLSDIQKQVDEIMRTKMHELNKRGKD